MVNIIPYPVSYTEDDGFFRIESNLEVYAASENCAYAEMFLLTLRPMFTAFNGKITENPQAAVRFETDAALEREAYRIRISSREISLSASGRAGFLYAVITLRHLVASQNEPKSATVSLDACTVEDAPNCEWRGLMLDESRNFFGAEEVKRILDLMARYKLNRFHWHLSDDQGFRIESEKFPLLNTIGSTRSDTQVNGSKSKRFRGIGHSGYYSRAEIKEIVAYAKERAIEIIPEINLPGHMTAIQAAYPELNCEREKPAVGTSFGDYSVIACLAGEQTYRFLQELLQEICELFPSKYFHIGGNAATLGQWRRCPECADFALRVNAETDRDLLAEFANRVSAILNALGKKAIVRDDSMSERLDAQITVQYESEGNLTLAQTQLRDGRKMILSRTPYANFDYPYALLPLSKVFGFSDQLKEFGELPDGWERRVLGFEALVWTEWIYDREKLEMNLLPRMAAFSEAAWSTERDYDGFLIRCSEEKKIWNALRVNYADDRICFRTSMIRKRRDIKMWRTTDQYTEMRRNRPEEE